MSNSRKLKKPHGHECSGNRKTIHMECPDHGDWELDVCVEGASDALAAIGAEKVFDCPLCGGAGTLAVHIGRAWLGEPRFIWRCDNGCPPAALRGALIEAGIALGCLGDYAGPGERTALYRMFDAADDLLYIGISNNFGRRWKQEAESKEWYPWVHRQTVEWYDSRTEALDAEELAIKAEHPKHNVQHNTDVPAAFRSKG